MAVQVFPVAKPSAKMVIVGPCKKKLFSAKRQLFGSPAPGECNALYRETEKNSEAILKKYVICTSEKYDEPLKINSHNTKFTSATSSIECSSRDPTLSCSSRDKLRIRVKPYRSQKKMTDYYKAQKSVTINNRVSDMRSAEEITGLVPTQRIQENVGIESTTTVLTTNESSSSSSSTHQCEHEQSQQQIALHTMTTDYNTTKIV